MKPKNLHTCESLAGAALLALAATLPAHADNYQTAVLAQNPAGYWRLDETVAPPVPPINAADLGTLGATGQGSYVLDVIRGQPGALFGSAATSCRFNNPGWNVTYLGSHVDVANNPALNPNGPFSVEVWARPASQAPDLFSPVCSLDGSPSGNDYRNGYLVYYDGAGSQWNFKLGGGTNVYTNVVATGQKYLSDISGGTATPGVWSHVVATYSGSSAALYVNGAQVAFAAVESTQFAPNTTQPFRIGATTIPNRTFDGWIQEVAFYNAALDGDTIAEHYAIGRTNGAAYPAHVLSSSPVGYWRLGEPGAPAACLGSLGAAGDGSYVYNAMPGQPGPAAPVFPGFASANTAVGFNGASGSVILPPLNLDTNTVTITAWVLPNGSQNSQAGLVVNRSGAGTAVATAAGLTMDVVAGLGVSYNWNNDQATYSWGSNLSLSDSVWNFVALVVQPTEADLYIVDSTNATDWSQATNYVSHAIQDFAGTTLIGDDSGETNFNGSIAQVAIFNRALGEGEVYSQYAAAVGGLGPQIFQSPAAPAGTVFAGDTVTLSVDAGGTPPLSYKWYYGTALIQGATNGTLTEAFGTTNTGNYSVVVRNSYGAATSGVAAISVAPVSAPSVLQGPVSRTLYPGGNLSLSVTASGGALSYQWQHAGTNLPGATSSTYQFTNITAAAAGIYTGIVSNRAGTAPFGPATITIPTPAAGSYEAAVTADKPEAWYRLDEAPGSANMWDSLGRHDGYYTNVSGSPVTLGVAGALVNDPDTAVSFDGTATSYGVAPYSAALNGASGTLECWVNTSVSSQSGVAVSSQFGDKGWFFSPIPFNYNPSGWTLYYDSGGQTFYTANTNASTAGAINLGWTHLVVVYDQNGGVVLYVNGYTDGTAYVPWDLNGAGPLLIGALGESSTKAPDGFFNGQVDEVAIYTRELSTARIQAHYQGRYGHNTLPLFLEPLVSQTVSSGRSVTFSTFVGGTLPITLQWHNGAGPVASATNSTLALTNVALGDTGTYTLWATNAAGVSSTNVTLTVLPAVGYANVTNGLGLHLKFDGDASDSSGHGNNGTLEGSPTFVTGKVGKALHYSTMTDTGASGGTVTNANYVSLGTPTNLNFGASGSSFSVAFWIRLPANYLAGDLPFFGSAVGSDNSFGFTFSPSYNLGGWQWCLDDGTNDIDVNGANNSINDGAWHHLAFTFDRVANRGLTYLDEVLVQSTAMAGLGNFDSGTNVCIGQDPTGAYKEPGSADIDDLGVWARVLSPAEICDIWSAASSAGRSFDTVAPSSGVTVTVTRAARAVQLSWPNGTLLESSSLAGPWKAVPGAAAPSYTVSPPTGAAMFYRVQVQ
ncbi:MAG: LamG-like jellyroll fold domain-containing protein [Verrucomicrobiota bacterium]